MLNTDNSEERSSNEKEPIEEKVFQFNANDEFYMAPPMCQLLHYRHAAIICGVLEALLLLGGVITFFGLHRNASLNSAWSTAIVSLILLIACTTSTIMVFGIMMEKPKLLMPQIKFLYVEIFILLFGAAGSIASMSLGIEWTHFIFSPFVSIPKMEQNFGPIWPFNVAIVAFSGAAIGIWMHVVVQGCYDYLLDKKYFESSQVPQPHIPLSAPGRL